MALSLEIIIRLSEKAGYDVTSPYGAYKLGLDINTQTGVLLGRNTVSRLVGVLPSNTKPRATTLNAIAIFLGYPNWGRLMQNKPTLKEGFYQDMHLTHDMESLPEGVLVEICWNPDRRLILKHLCCGRYEVLLSENGKLRKGDILKIHKLSIGLPFVADQIRRNHELLGCYAAAAGSAIIKMEVVSK